MRCTLALLVVAAAAAGGEKDLSHDDGKLADKRSTAGTGHVISFDAPKGTWWVRSVLVHGARYGGGYDPSATTFTVTICDGDLKPLGATTAPYELFAPGKFEWVEVPLAEPVAAPARMKVVVEFRPTATQGVYVGISETGASHSGHAVPGGAEKPFAREWMIRARLSSEKPKPRKPDPGRYTADFEFLAKTVEARFPALKKKGVDWQEARREWRPKFAAAKSDREHVLNAMQLLALLGDMHTGVIDTKVEPPAFEGLYGAGLWIAADEGRLVLRAAVPGHPLLERVRPGAELLTIGGKPARLVHLATRAQLKRWYGWSSDHFLDARLGFQFFPFGKQEKLHAEFLDPSGAVVALELERWGPGGRGSSPVEATMPEGVKAQGLAVSARLDGKTGYLRILGGMNDETRAAVDKAFDELKGVDGIVLDCRGMGGGSDHPAWAMAGRFFTESVAMPPIKPTGSWQFDGPVVLLQDERMVSSAETFTWAMTETGRALSVGRPTGGGTIIPEAFEVPSGLFRFRLGVHDRKTPVKGVQPEGVGTPPYLLVAYEPALLAKYGDPVLGIAREVLGVLRESGDPGEEIARPPVPEAVEWQIRLLEEPRNPMPDFVRGCRNLRELGGAKSARSEHPAASARALEASGMWAKEEAAQQACEEILAKDFPPKPGGAQAFLREHGGTRWAEALKAYLR